MATRAGRQARGAYAVEVNGYISLFTSLFCTAFTVDGIKLGEDGLDSTYILKTLFERGKIAFDKETGLWLRYSNVGKPNAYGDPMEVRLYGANGTNYRRKRGDVYLFKATPTGDSVGEFIRKKCEFLANCDAAISQNLDAIKQMTILTAQNDTVGEMLTFINTKRESGASVCVANPYAFASTDEEAAAASLALASIGTLKTGADFLVDKIRAEKRREYEEILHILGIQTGYEKGERMTDDEIQTFNAESRAYVSVTAQTFNQAAKAQGAPFRLLLVDREEETKKEEAGEVNNETNI